MNSITQKWSLALGLLAVTASLATSLSSCTQVESKQPSLIQIDGSDTVYPVTQAISKAFHKAQTSKVQVKVSFSGTGGGFKKFCTGQTDINDASRPILAEEMATCRQAGVRFMELPIAFDALTVVVNPQNDWAKDITIKELQAMWSPDAQGKTTRWNQIRASWPNRPLSLYGPSQNNGTFDYFTEATVGQVKASRSDYIANTDYNLVAQGVSKDPNALGYFGYAYYQANRGKLKALAIDNGKGPVLPSRQTVEKAQYQPLSRPLFIYVNIKSAQDKPEVKDFVDFYLQNAPTIASSVGYVPLPDEAYHLDYLHFSSGKVGTVFAGKPQLDLTISKLLRKQATF